MGDVSCLMEDFLLFALQPHHGLCEQRQREVPPEEETERHVLVAVQ